MIISHRHRFIYFGPPKTGSTSLATFFIEHFEGEYCYRPECDPTPDRFVTSSGRAQHQIILPLEFADYLTVLSVRNPYTRLFSMYSFFRERHPVKTIEEYFPHAQPPVTQELNHDLSGCAPMRIDQILRVETLQADVNLLPFVGEPITVPHENKSPALFIPMTNQIIDFVNTLYRSDFEAFGYTPLPCFHSYRPG